ncbi:MAG: efflux RND transporter periplasmic adaptor subunit [Gammaproteobacteria bacterium]|nr:MAG: efflux RND transporter periplasmic adaptor subunit [Gammaproteobacteria bacterium]
MSSQHFTMRANRLASPILVILLSGFLISCDASHSEPTDEPRVSEQPSLTTAVRVKVAPIVSARIDRAGTVTGLVSAFRKATVAAEVGGRVVKRLVEPGATVEKGQLLIELDQHRAHLAVEQAKAIASARAVDRNQATHQYRRGRDLFAKSVISEDTLDDLRFAEERTRAQLLGAQAQLSTARRALADTRILAPFKGTAEIVHVQEGDYLQPGTAIATLTDFSKVRIRAGVTATEANSIAPGQVATLHFQALGGVALPGRVQNVGRIADAASGTYAVEIWLDGPETARLREGMMATVTLPSSARATKTAAPASAVFRKNGRTHIYTIFDDKAKLTPVRVGLSNGKLVEILEGVSAGELVVVDGQFALRDGANVTVDDPR